MALALMRMAQYISRDSDSQKNSQKSQGKVSKPFQEQENFIVALPSHATTRSVISLLA